MTVSQINTLRMPPFDDGGRVVRVSDPTLGDAAARLVARGRDPDRAGGDRFIRYARENEIPLGWMWVWQSPNGAFDAAVLAVPNAGKTAMVFASHPVCVPGRWHVAALLRHAAECVTELDLSLAQALLEPRERVERRIFQSAGFEFLAHLSYLQRSATGFRKTPPPRWPADASVESFADVPHDEFLSTLAESYEDSLDCPRLAGLRRPEEILAGHQGAGLFDPNLWTLLRVGERAAGVLLMNRSSEPHTIELVYLGLAPWGRGRGLGKCLLRHGLQQCEGAGVSAITLAVDEQNTPAMRLYATHGFRRVLRRVAMVRPLRAATVARLSEP